MLNALDVLSESRRREICDWIYRFQIVSQGAPSCSGFQGSSTINILNSDPNACGSEKYKWGHLAMTYTGISILITLGDDLKRLNRKAIIEGVAAVQRTDGSFSASIEGNEHDMRFVYCAAAICYMLDDWGTVDKQLMAEYIKNSIVRCNVLLTLTMIFSLVFFWFRYYYGFFLKRNLDFKLVDYYYLFVVDFERMHFGHRFSCNLCLFVAFSIIHCIFN